MAEISTGDRVAVIGIDASRANAERRTGTEWYAHHVINELKRIIPPDVRVVLYSKEPLRDGLEQLPANWRSAVLRWTPGRFWTQLRLSFEILTRPPDLLFVPAHAMPVILPPLSMTTIHDVAFMALPEAYGRFERAYHRFAARHALRSADRLLTVSEFSKREIVRYFSVGAEEIAVTPLGYDAARFRPIDDADIAKAKAAYGVDGPYFLFVGRIETKKNIEGLLAAFATYRQGGGDAKLVLVGKRGRGGDAAMERAARSAVGKEVLELGYVAPDDLPGLYAGATALTFVSRYEGFGIPALEAFATRTPVICADTTSLPEVCGDAAYYVHPDDIDGIATAMRRLREEPELAGQLRAQGERRLARYGWERTAAATWEAMRDLLEAAQNKKGRAA